ncbi:hypothetical protein [Desulfitobacterium chlororespirans]|uniref:Uncharacterized protein n=1 Tax=Desulfitobacterium chlororespirans DSM 11544 TaxID=1121395 RepID=A0A1M7UYA1_9FIRM|nr:hypothetical protein [Desulfitobacterium chlororespirans]SHN87944.1 hypothetical protein SAMN02745215_05043 [Desulfitobacterium chlororespirans DSM 11544]
MFDGYIIKRKPEGKKNLFVYLSRDDGNEYGYGWGKILEFKDIYHQVDQAMAELRRLHSIPQCKEDVENENIYIAQLEITCREREDKSILTHKNGNDYWVS